MQNAAQVQAQIEELNQQIAVLYQMKNAAEARHAEILRANKYAAQTDSQNFNAAMLSLEAFQAWLIERKGKQRSEKRALETCQDFLAFLEELRRDQQSRINPRFRELAKSASLVAALADAVQNHPHDFETIDKKHQAIERYAHALEGGRSARRKLGLVMRSVGTALLILSLFAAVSLVFLPIILPVSTVVLIGAGVVAALLLGVHTRFSGKDEISASQRVGLPQKMLLFGDALKDKAHQKDPHKISAFEGCRRRWFR